MLVFVCRPLLMKLRASSKQALQLGRDDVFAQRLLGTGDALGELEHELALLDVVGDVDQVFDEGHGESLPRDRSVRQSIRGDE